MRLCSSWRPSSIRFFVDLYNRGRFFFGRLGDEGVAAARALDLFPDESVRDAQ
jgi:hypothetical protein